MQVAALMSAPMTISEYMTKRGLSQSAFGNLVGRSQGRVSQWLRGETITAETARHIERATAGEVSAAELRPDLFGQQAA